MARVQVLILRAPGANCDREAQYAFERAGAMTERLHINRLRDDPALLQQFQILCIPGGFTYGDDVAAGKILAVQLRSCLSDALAEFREAGKLILGICNGFQVLLKAGLLVPLVPDPVPHPDPARQSGTGAGWGTGTGSCSIRATLTTNACGKFEDRWITMKATPGFCPFLHNYELLECPIAHGEGRFVCRDAATLLQLEKAGQVVLRYVDAQGNPGPYPINPNGSQADIAGICDPTGRVLGLMPHPERHALPTQHPQWTRKGLASDGDGLLLFQNAVRYFQQW